jgi:multidrug efflux pump subunit AcrB
MYLLPALHYNSYLQPLLIFSVIPFSSIGAVGAISSWVTISPLFL